MEIKKNQDHRSSSTGDEKSVSSRLQSPSDHAPASPLSGSFGRGWLRHLAAAALVPQTLSPTPRAEASDQRAHPPPIVQLTPSGVINLALERFDSLDTNKDSFIGQEEVATFAKRVDLLPNESQLAASLVSAYPGIVTTTVDLGDGLLREWEISRGDLKGLNKQLGKVAVEVESAQEARRFLLNEKGFERIDQNGDLALDRAEVQRATGSIDPQVAEVARVIKASYSDIRATNTNELPEERVGITKDDLLYYSSTIVEAHGPKSAYLSMTSAISGSHRAVSERLSNVTWEAIRTENFAIVPEAVQQGRTGNCYFLASLLSLSSVDPELLRNIITSSGDGKFTVQFPGDPNNAIVLELPTDVERALFAKAARPQYSWVPILEKAAGLYVQREGAHYLGSYDDQVLMLPAQYIGGGGWAEYSLELVTGNKATRYDYRAGQKGSVQPMERVLEGAFEPGARTAVVASTAYRGEGCKVNEAGLVTSHAYAVLGYSVSAEGEGSVIIANPHGDNPRFEEAALIMPLSLFQKHFDVIQTCPTSSARMAKSE